MTVKCTLKGNWKNNTISLVVVCCLVLRLRNFVDHYVFDDGILWMFPNSVNGISLFGETDVEPRGCLFERRILRTMCKEHFPSHCKLLFQSLQIITIALL